MTEGTLREKLRKAVMRQRPPDPVYPSSVLLGKIFLPCLFCGKNSGYTFVVKASRDAEQRGVHICEDHKNATASEMAKAIREGDRE